MLNMVYSEGSTMAFSGLMPKRSLLLLLFLHALVSMQFMEYITCMVISLHAASQLSAGLVSGVAWQDAMVG